MYRYLLLISVLLSGCLFLTAGTPEAAAVPAAVGTESARASAESKPEAAAAIDIPAVIFSHIGDSYEWHISKFGKRDIAIPLPVIVYGKNSGFNIFSSKKLEHGSYKGFHIAPQGSRYEGKIVELIDGVEHRPFDISITKNVLSLMASSLLLLVIVLLSARWYKKHDVLREQPRGIAALMEPVIMMVHNMAKENIGEEDYKRYSPYLIMAFLFIFINNILGIIPVFPFGANLTGNIAVTMTLALITFLTVNLTGTGHYFKEIFLPEVPIFLKPIMPVIEVFSALMKPLSLTIRLFANMLAGHIQILSVVCIIFIISKYGAMISGTMSAVSVAFGIFLNFLEMLVSFIQAYVFTMLSSIYIGLARQKH